MKYDFIIFGGTGRQGRICAKDLIGSGYSVLLAGRDKSGIEYLLDNKSAGFIKVDLRNNKEIVSAINKSGAEIVINCAELIFNIQIMKACLETKKSCTDLGGLHDITVKQFKMDNQFKKAGILNLTGCGSTPGLANVMAAYVVNNLDSAETITLGFAWDSNIKKFVVPYSIQSIFNELENPAVTFHSGKFMRESRMRCTGTMNFKAVGVQTVYRIAHSEVYTFSKYFKHKGIKNIRYMAGFPEHSINTIKTLMDLGFNSKEKIDVNGYNISPLDFTISLFKSLKIPENYKEVENIWVSIEGIKSGKKKKIDMNCIINTIPGWEADGSNIDTGRTISIMSQMLKKE